MKLPRGWSLPARKFWPLTVSGLLVLSVLFVMLAGYRQAELARTDQAVLLEPLGTEAAFFFTGAVVAVAGILLALMSRGLRVVAVARDDQERGVGRVGEARRVAAGRRAGARAARSPARRAAGPRGRTCPGPGGARRRPPRSAVGVPTCEATSAARSSRSRTV